MSRLLLFLCFLSLFTITLKAQSYNAIEMNHKKLHYSILVEQGAKLTVIRNKQIIKGRLQAIADNWLVIGEDTIAVDSIDKLFARTYSSRFGGVVFGAIGTTVDGLLIYSLSTLSNSTGVYTSLPIVYASLFAGTYFTIKAIQLFSRGRKFKTRIWKILPTNIKEEPFTEQSSPSTFP